MPNQKVTVILKDMRQSPIRGINAADFKVIQMKNTTEFEIGQFLDERTVNHLIKRNSAARPIEVIIKG